jgi:hypothetical protein
VPDEYQPGISVFVMGKQTMIVHLRLKKISDMKLIIWVLLLMVFSYSNELWLEMEAKENFQKLCQPPVDEPIDKPNSKVGLPLPLNYCSLVLINLWAT